MTTYDVILRGEQCTTNARSKRGRKRLKDRFLFLFSILLCSSCQRFESPPPPYHKKNSTFKYNRVQIPTVRGGLGPVTRQRFQIFLLLISIFPFLFLSEKKIYIYSNKQDIIQRANSPSERKKKQRKQQQNTATCIDSATVAMSFILSFTFSHFLVSIQTSIFNYFLRPNLN